MKAVGIHVFAGGFTMGVQKVFDVQCQLEKHNFGRETTEAVCGVPFVNHDDAQWPDVDAQFAYGNPRCTGFSSITGGYGADVHGAWSAPTRDIHELCEYAAGRYDAVIWESVQQAMSVGRPLLDYLRDEIFVPKNYRIAHVMLNAASFGNTQNRKRYFFVAYRDDRNFNIVPPEISDYEPTAYDAIWKLKDRETHEAHITSSCTDYTFDSYARLTDEEKHIVPNLPNGWNVNTLAAYNLDALPRRWQEMWHLRTSDMPFSMHCIYRMNWLRPFPTIHSSAARFIHPEHNRPLTVGELATAMGWSDIPRGPKPVNQIAKGVCPEAGEWLANQVKLYLEDYWGEDDWESSYNPTKGEWEGRNAAGAKEKYFNLTQYVGSHFDIERYSDVKPIQRYRHPVDARTGRPLERRSRY